MNKEYREWFGYVMLSVVIYMLGTLIPLAALFMPVPFMLLGYRFAKKAVIFAAFAATLSIYLPDILENGVAAAVSAGNIFGVLSFLMTCVVTGVLFGKMARKSTNAAEWLLSAIEISVAVKVVLLILFVRITGVNPFAVLNEAVKAASSGLISSMPFKDAQLMQETMQDLYSEIKILFPAILIIFSAADSFCSYKLTERHLKQKNVTLPSFDPFGAWRCPKSISTAILISLLLSLAVYFKPLAALNVISANLMLVLRAVFTLEGMSVIWYIMGRNRVAKALRLPLLVFSIIFMALFTYPYSFIGIIDIWYDLRKLGGKKDESNS